MMHQTVVELLPVQFSFSSAQSQKNEELRTPRKPPAVVNVTPVIINFHRLLFDSKLCEDAIPGIPNREVLHATAALYDRSLPDVTEDIIYSTVCEKHARTILLVWDRGEALENFKIKTLSDIQESPCLDAAKLKIENAVRNTCEGDAASSLQSSGSKSEQPSAVAAQDNREELRTADCENKKSIQATREHSDEDKFAHVFSDMEASDSDEDNEEDEDFTCGVDNFLKNVAKRKEKKASWMESIKNYNFLGEPDSLIGIEHRLLGCCTFEKLYEKPGHKVIQLTLVAVRKAFRKMGLGRFLVRIVRNPVIAGNHDVVLVNADHNATDFFEKEGFTDDVLVNSKYAEVGDTWYNCKKMCYLPPYQSNFDSLSTPGRTDLFLDELENVDLKQMELDIALFQEKSLQAFQSQASVVQRLRKEILLLRAEVSAQQDTINALTKENGSIRDAKYACEKQLLRLKLAAMTKAAENLKFDWDDVGERESDDAGENGGGIGGDDDRIAVKIQTEKGF